MKTKMRIMMTALALVLGASAGTLQAQVTADDIELAVETDLGIGDITTYLELTKTGGGTGDSREGLSLATADDTWGYPDGSDDSLWVNENCLDEKDHTASDFVGTISGLNANTNCDLYVVAAGRKAGSGAGTYDFSWGTIGDGSAVNTVSGVNNVPGAVEIAEQVSGDITTSMAVPIGNFTSDGTGNLAIYLGRGQVRDGNNYRTQFDGLVVIPSSSDGKLSPSVDAGPDQVLVWPDDEVTLAATIQDDGDPNKVLKYWWEVTGQSAGANVNLTNPAGLGPFTITVKEGGDAEPNQPYAVTPTATVSQSGIYELTLSARDEKSDSNDTVRIFVYPAGYDCSVAHWKLDDGIDTGPATLTAIDSAGSYDPNFDSYNFDHTFYPGTLNGETDTGEPNWVDGVDYTDTMLLDSPTDFIGALWLDGADDFIEVPYQSALGLTKNFTIAAWVKPNLQGSTMGIVTKLTGTSDKQYGFSINGSGNLGIEYEASGNNYSYWGGGVSDGVWQHVAITIDNNLLIQLYINGVPAGSETAPAEVQALTDPINIGRWAGTYNDRYFDGIIDDVHMYNVVKTQQEILAIAGITNTAPVADAGDNRRLIEDVGGASLELDATVEDLPGNYDATWTVLSGPGTISFTLPGGNDKEDQLATIDDSSAYGLYHLQLAATDTDNPAFPPSTDDMYLMYQEKAQYSTNRDAPMALWKLDEVDPATVAMDSSGNGFHGPLATSDTVDPNLPEWHAAGKIDGALQFANAGDDQIQYVDLGKVPGSDDLTVMLWVKPALVAYMDPINKIPNDGSGAGWAVKLRDNGEIWFRIGSQDNRYNVESNATRYDADEWIHIAATFDGATKQGVLYINGLEVNRGATSDELVNNIGTPLRLAAPPNDATTDFFRGLVDQVRIYDLALSELDIALLAVADDVAMEDCIPSIPGVPMASDLDGDCYIGVKDLKLLLGNWLDCSDLNNPNCW